MYYFKKKEIDSNIFVGDKNAKISKYGLPNDVKYCKKCLTSNQRATTRSEQRIKKLDQDIQDKTLKFFDDNICGACKIKEGWKNIDIEKRKNDFLKILEKYRSKNGDYDVVVPGSGGKDSFYVAHKLKHEYGMNPITVTFSPFLYTDWGWKNLQNWISAGFENILNSPNRKIYRLLSRMALENMFHPWHPWILGQKNFPPKIAAKLGIPLVIYGESPAEYCNPIEEYREEYMIDWHTIDNKENLRLSGEKYQDLLSMGLKKNDLEPFVPMLKDEFIKKKIKCFAFSYFHGWHPQSNYYYAVQNSNFQTSDERTIGTYTKSGSIDDKMDHFYYHTYYIKFGIGRATHDVSQEIRNGDISIKEGKNLINKYDGEFPEKVEKEIYKFWTIDKSSFSEKIVNLFECPEVNREYYNNLSNYFRSPHIWKKNNMGFVLRKNI